MRILYIADGRSPIALNWIDYFIRAGHEVHLVSTFHCQAVPGVASSLVIPVALSGFYSHSDQGRKFVASILRKLIPVQVRTRVRQLAAPLSFPQVTRTLQEFIERIQPDLVHAMRIPYEGMIAADAIENMPGRAIDSHPLPLLISVWGNDFTLHAKSTVAMMSHTRKALRIATGLHTDCQRDQRLAIELGFEATKPKIILPGGGGVQIDIFYPTEPAQIDVSGGPNAALTIINPRGFRAYVRNDTFFQAIPMVIDQYPGVRFCCPDMQGEGQAEGWIAELGIEDNVQLLPAQSRQQMAELFRQSQISLSITTHDGTPNTLLEAMACGCFPIAGDIESLREWITSEVNGFLVDPDDPEELAKAILKAIAQPELRKGAREMNLSLVRERAEHGKCMGAAEDFYQRLVE